MILLKKIIKTIVLYLLVLKNFVRCHSIPSQNVNGNKSSNTLFELLNVAESVINSAKQYARITAK